METIRKINVNNQRVLVLSKEGNTLYKWLEDKQGNKDLDPFWNSEITEDIFNQVLEDYNSGLIQYVYGDFPTVKNPIENLSDNDVLNITNWIAYAYMTWNKNNWNYGKNKNYDAELKQFTR